MDSSLRLQNHTHVAVEAIILHLSWFLLSNMFLCQMYVPPNLFTLSNKCIYPYIWYSYLCFLFVHQLTMEHIDQLAYTELRY